MGLSRSSMGANSIDSGLVIKKVNETDRIIALAGNPNVGKSTVFNALTGLNQHTGNWPGKTVTNAQGYFEYESTGYILVDLPGCYSLMAHSAEEEVARDFICFEKPDAVIAVCDGTCIERNLNLVLQILEITPNVIVCINLLDEAKKKNITVDLQALSNKLGVPVVGTDARRKKGLNTLMEQVSKVFRNPSTIPQVKTQYPVYIETGIRNLEPTVREICKDFINPRWLSLKILENDKTLLLSANKYLNTDILSNPNISTLLRQFAESLEQDKITEQKMKDDIVGASVATAENICQDSIDYENKSYNLSDRKIDRLLTGKRTGFPLMILALSVIFWITISGANYPSQLISNALFWVEEHLLNFFIWLGTPQFLYELLVLGVYRVTAWVVSVMLPPMAIFFPLFTLLEDVGYLPRIAFNLDKCYKRCCACGKQALTMWMGNICN